MQRKNLAKVVVKYKGAGGSVHSVMPLTVIVDDRLDVSWGRGGVYMEGVLRC